MPTITYSYDVNEPVWTVDAVYGVRDAVVKRVDIISDANNIPPRVKYTVMFVNANAGSNIVDELHIFGNVDNALTAYRSIIT